MSQNRDTSGDGVSVELVGRTMAALLAGEGRPIIYRDQTTGRDLSLSPEAAASPSGLLPAFVVAGEAVWREATGKGFKLDMVADRAALLGYRLAGIGAGSLTTVLLATMEATAQVAGLGVILVNDLDLLWSTATARIERAARPASPSPSGATAPVARPAPGPGPGPGS